jgi:hypothetical protein
METIYPWDGILSNISRSDASISRNNKCTDLHQNLFTEYLLESILDRRCKKKSPYKGVISLIIGILISKES